MVAMTALSPAPAPWDEAPKQAAPWDEAPKQAALRTVANMLFNAGLTGRPARAADELLAPYAEQGAEDVAVTNFRRGTDEGCRVAGRAVTVVDTPAGEVAVGGYYFGGAVHATGTGIPDTLLVRPRVSATLALRVGRRIDRPDVTVAEILGAVDGVHAALVVACPRVGEPAGSTVLECIADNAHAGHVVVSDTWIVPSGADPAGTLLDIEVGVPRLCTGRTRPPRCTWSRRCAERSRCSARCPSGRCSSSHRPVRHSNSVRERLRCFVRRCSGR